MKSFEKSCRFEESARLGLRGAAQPNRGTCVSGGGLCFREDRYRSANVSPKLRAIVSGVRPNSESDSVMLVSERGGRPTELVLEPSGEEAGSGARGAMLVLTTGRSAGGDARRGGDGVLEGVPGESPDTADCYGHCW